MKKYQILEHKADLKIRAFGRNKKELFLNAMKGMQDLLLAEVKNQKLKVRRKIKIKSDNLASLLVDFLSEINYLNEVKKEIYFDIKFSKFSDKELEGEIFGRKAERFGLSIKGATWHNLEVRQRKDKIWQATILFDI